MIIEWLDRMENDLEERNACFVRNALSVLGYIDGCGGDTCDECKVKAREKLEDIRREVYTTTENVTAGLIKGLMDSLDYQYEQPSHCFVADVLKSVDERFEHVCDGLCDNKTPMQCDNAVSNVLTSLRDRVCNKTECCTCKSKQAINEENTVKYINLDALDSLKYKLKEKYDVLFNKFEVTEFERGELDAFTQTLYMIDDIMEKQATSDKTSDKTSYIEEQMRELSRKPLHDAETIARALEKVNNQSDKVNHPTHYNVHKHECIDEMVAVFGVEAVKCFCKCNAWKYRYRSVAKNGEEDLAKADWYIEKLMELEKDKNGVYL